MLKSSRDFLTRLLMTPSPSGAEMAIQRVVREEMGSIAEAITTDVHGNVILGVNVAAKRKVMIAGHCDQIGFMVKHITRDGYLYVFPVGGIDVGVLAGTKVQILGERGPISGVFGRKAIHLQTAEERGKASLDLEKMWVDVGASSDREVEKAGIRVGDFATFVLEPMELANRRLVGAGLDNRVGLFVALEALRLCAKKKKSLKVGVYAVSTVQEELGLRGARTASYALDPDVGISVDVTHATDNPSTEGQKRPPCGIGKGPGIYRGPNINPVLQEMLVATAKKRKIPYQLLPHGGVLSNDAGAIQVSKSGVATASIGIPNRYMHTQAEMCSLDDLAHAAELLAAFVEGITEKTSFIPM